MRTSREDEGGESDFPEWGRSSLWWLLEGFGRGRCKRTGKGGGGGGRQEAAAPEPPGRGWGAATPQKDGDAPHREPARNAKAAGWAAVEPEN